MATNFQKVTEHTRREQGIVPFDQQTPEQREEFVGRVRCLNVVNINMLILLENWAHISAGMPDKKSNPRLFSNYRKMVDTVQAMVSNSKMLQSQMQNILLVDDQAKEKVETYSWYNKTILDVLLTIPNERIALALQTVQAFGKQDGIKAMSDQDYEDETVAFGNYCAKLIASGRKKINHKDYQKFKESRS